MNIDDLDFEGRKKYAKMMIERGTVIKIHSESAQYSKFFVVLGIDGNRLYGLLYINSIVNERVNISDQLKSLHFKILKERNSFLAYDSFVDCTTIEELEIAKDIHSSIPGNIDFGDIDEIVKLAASSPVIEQYKKKKYNLL